ncbi:Transporter of the ATP-binding cassette (ABC), partial [Coemansia erecta]
MAVGAKKTPVRRPPGPAILIDSRLRMGSFILAVLAIQTALYAVWWYKSNSTKYSLYPAALAQSTAMILLASAAFLAALLRSDRMVYAGLFPWILPALVGIQFVAGIAEIYASFFTDKNLSVPIVGPRASLRSNLLVATSAGSVVLIVLFSRVQQRPMFIRATDSSEETSSLHTLPEEDSSADCNDTTPLARPNEHKASDLVDTLESRSSLFDRLSFSWANDLLGKGSGRQLQYTDLYRLDQTNMPVANWRRYLRHRKPGRSLFIAMVITFAPEFLTQAVLSVIRSILEFGGPFFLQRILRAIEHTSDESSPSTTNFRKTYLDAFGLLSTILVGTMFGNQTLWIGRNIGIRLKGLL